VREVVWRANARDNLIEIIRFISSENIAAAKRLQRQIQGAIHSLNQHRHRFNLRPQRKARCNIQTRHGRVRNLCQQALLRLVTR
jgi:plasmid stabilization system protein ParE